MLHLFRSIFLSLLLYTACASAALSPVNINSSEKVYLLEHSELFISSKEIPLKEVVAKRSFRPLHKEHLNLGISKDFIYIHFILENWRAKPASKVLVLSSPLLEDITLYTEKDLTRGISKGILHIDDPNHHHTLPFHFRITQAPNSVTSYYLKIHSNYNNIDFALTLEDTERFLESDRIQQAIDLVLIGMIIALMLYSLFLSYYIRDRSYFFYSLYLMMLIWQQLTYLGLTQVFFPKQFILFDLYIDIIKLSLLIVTSALFAIHFLETKHHRPIHLGYLAIILFVSFELIFLPSEKAYSFYMLIFSGIFFIVFNLFSGIYIYRQGLKQARLFIVGFGIVSIFYLMMIFDAMGVSSLMYYFQNALVWGSTLEAFILSLAFADRYLILQKEKHAVQQQILYETQHRTALIEEEVIQKTKELNQALETKELLIHEIHHRVKNNLQIILSMIRLQNMELDDPKAREKLTDLEYRINAIAKTYTMLLNNENIEEINMESYIETLLLDISESYDYAKYRIEVDTDIHATMPIRASIYIGLIINELVTNSYKHAFPDGTGTITIELQEEARYYTLTVKDSGKGFSYNKQKSKSLGLKLIYTLVYDQLEGTMDVFTEQGTKFIIRFKL